jgi:endonuclease G
VLAHNNYFLFQYISNFTSPPVRVLSRFIVALLLLVFTSGGYAANVPESCKEYAKMGVPGESGTLLCRKGYLLAHDTSRKTPIWVAEHLTYEKASASLARSNNFQADPDLEEGERAELSDYKGSGYDRGHMAPAGDMRWDPQAMTESFFLSNMVPQVGRGMNQGIWRDLEEKVRQWALNRGEVYIYTGPIYANGAPKTIGANKVAVPTHLYKVVYDPIQVEAIAFIMPNMKLKSSDMPNYIVTIREVEAQTGLDFLPRLKKKVEDAVESAKAEALWDEADH